MILLIIWWAYYLKVVYPKQKSEKEKKLREKILNELKNDNK